VEVCDLRAHAFDYPSEGRAEDRGALKGHDTEFGDLEFDGVERDDFGLDEEFGGAGCVSLD
jgi:hypothetical protein